MPEIKYPQSHRIEKTIIITKMSFSAKQMSEQKYVIRIGTQKQD